MRGDLEKGLRRARVPALLLIAAVTVVLGHLAWDAPVDRTGRSLRADAARGTDAGVSSDAVFPGGDPIVVTCTRADLLSPAGAKAVAALHRRLEAIPGVRRVDSLANVVEIVPGPFGAEPRAIVPDPEAADAGEIAAAIDRNPHLTGLLVSRDRRTAAFVVELEPPPSQGPPDRLEEAVQAIERLAEERAPDRGEVHVTGMAVAKIEIARLVERDRRLLMPACVVALATALGLAYRRRSAVVLPLAVTAVAVQWTLGLYVATGHTVDVVTALLPLLIMTVSVSTSVHLYSRWATDGGATRSRERRAVDTVRVLFAPCALASWTTMLGLLSLSTSDLPAVRAFGRFGAAGVAIAFVLNVTLLPLLLSMLTPPDRRPVAGTPLLDRSLRALGRAATSRPVLVLAGTAVVVAIAGIGLARVRNNTDLISYLKPGERLARDTRLVEERLGGTSVLELLVERTDGAPLVGVADVRGLEAAQERIVAVDAVDGALGLPDLLAAVNRAETARADAGLPSDGPSIAAAFDLLDAAEDPETVGRVLSGDHRVARFLVRIGSLGSAEAARVFARIMEAARDALGDGYRVTAVGSFHDVVADSNALVASLARSAGIALIAILVSIGVVVRSPRVLAAAAVPNVVPVLATFGFMGFAGIDLSTGTAMIASVVLGIAVDDTIHWLARYRASPASGVRARAFETTTSVGRPLTIASVVLVVGFWVGALGSFRPTIYFSVLTGATILGALLCDLLVLPACLVLFERRDRPSPS